MNAFSYKKVKALMCVDEIYLFSKIFFSPKECATYYVAQPSSSDHSEVKEEERQDDADENEFSLK